MSFAREMGNVATTLAGLSAGAFLGGVIAPKGTFGTVVVGTTALAGGYLGNLVLNGKSADETKKMIRERAVGMLVSKGIAQDQASAMFEQYYDIGNAPKVGFLRNIGNVITTNIGAAIGGTTALLVTGGIALNQITKKSAKEFNPLDAVKMGGGLLVAATLGSLGGGYLGNKVWQGPSKTAVDERAVDIVSKILAERKPVANMSQVEALQHREEQRTQSAEKVR